MTIVAGSLAQLVQSNRSRVCVVGFAAEEQKMVDWSSLDSHGSTPGPNWGRR